MQFRVRWIQKHANSGRDVVIIYSFLEHPGIFFSFNIRFDEQFYSQLKLGVSNCYWNSECNFKTIASPKELNLFFF